MSLQDSSPERRNVIVLSLLTITFFVAEGKIDGPVKLPVTNITLENASAALMIFWIVFLWVGFRYLIALVNQPFDENISHSGINERGMMRAWASAASFPKLTPRQVKRLLRDYDAPFSYSDKNETAVQLSTEKLDKLSIKPESDFRINWIEDREEVFSIVNPSSLKNLAYHLHMVGGDWFVVSYTDEYERFGAFKLQKHPRLYFTIIQQRTKSLFSHSYISAWYAPLLLFWMALLHLYIHSDYSLNLF